MNTKTALVGAGLAVVAVVLLIVLSSGGSDEGGNGDAGKVPTVVVDKEGKPVGGVADLAYSKGDTVHFKVESAVADEIHVHGYDLMKDVEAGGAVSFDFPASIEGVFEAELEDRGEQIVELKVEP